MGEEKPVGGEVTWETPVSEAEKEGDGREREGEKGAEDKEFNEKLYEESRDCSRRELAEWLRHLAEQVAGGAVTVGTSTVPVPEMVKVEFEYEEKHDKKELEIEVTWGG